jgi:hypothetical protein
VLKFAEVYEKKVRNIDERTDGSEFVTFGSVFDTRDCLINKDYIVAVQPHDFSSSRDQDRIDQAFAEGTKFSTITVDGNSFRKSEIIVVGSFEKLCGILQDSPT